MRLELDDEDVERIASRVAEIVAAQITPGVGRGRAVGWMDMKMAAAYAGCSTTALQKSVARREVRCSQNGPGGKCWFKAEWIDQWRENG